MTTFSRLWQSAGKPGGFFQVLRVAFPLILAATGHAVNLFSDRVMMQHYSDEAGAAAFPAGLTSFTLSCLFVGMIGYAGSFVAQYYGAGAYKRVGTTLWQAIWLSVIGGLLLGTGWFWADWLFSFFPHTGSVREQEVAYFQILSLGAGAPLLYGALSTFWSGRGETILIMIVNFVITACNIPLNYIFIYGKCGFPEMGIKGAAYGTVAACLIGVAIFAAMLFRREYVTKYDSLHPVFDGALLMRMIRFGFPSGVQLFLDLLAFNIFIVLLGGVGANDTEKIQIQVASTIAFSLNSISFTPMVGLGQGVSILVGQAVGSGKIAQARRTVSAAMLICSFYMILMAVFFVIYPDILINMFVRNDGSSQEGAIQMSRIFLRFIAAYTLFDGMNIIYSGAVKGAGDTRFAMVAASSFAIVLFAVPCLFAYFLFHSGVYVFWFICDTYIILLSIVFIARYRQGKWRRMRVIEDQFARPLEDV